MKRLLFFVLTLITINCFAQPTGIPNYTDINARYNWLGAVFRAITIPAGTTPALKSGQPGLAGALFVDSTGGNKGLFYYRDGVFIRLVDTTMTVSNTFENVLNTSSALTIDHSVTAAGTDFVWTGFDDYLFNFDSLYLQTLGLRNDTSGQKIMTWNTSSKSVSYSSWRDFTTGSNGVTLSGFDAQIGHVWGSTTTDIASNAARQLKIDTSTFWFKGVDIASVPAFRNAIGLRLSDSTTHGPEMLFLGGGAIKHYMTSTAGDQYPSINWYVDGTLAIFSGAHYTGADKHYDIFDLSPSSPFTYAAMQFGSTSYHTFLNNGTINFGVPGTSRVGINTNQVASAFLAHFQVNGSSYFSDTVRLAKKMFITDSTGYDVVFSERASPYKTKMMTVPDLRILLGISGATTWNSIGDPTGDLALTFGAGESTTFTDQNTTENTFTLNNATQTNNKLWITNSTSTAKTMGNAGRVYSSTGVNATSGITVVGDSITVGNSGTTSTNVAFKAEAVNGTVNIGVRSLPNVIVGTPTLDALNGLIVQSRSNTGNEGMRVYLNNLTANAMYGPQGLLASGSYIIDAPSGLGFNYSGTRKATQLSTGQFRIGDASTAPTAWVHLAAGTTAASTSPFKLTTGPFNTTAEAGGMEYTTPQLTFTNGTAIRQEIQLVQQSRVSTQYDNTTTTLGNVTGLTANVAASGTYRFEAILYTTSNIGGGIKAAIAGTATATNIIYEGFTIDAGATTQTRAPALATAVGGVTAVTAAYVRITGTITVNAAGTLTVQAAANTAVGTTSVLVGSTFTVNQIL